MHVLAVNSVTTLLNYLKEQLQNTPTLAQIQGKEESDEMAEKDEDKGTIPPSMTGTGTYQEDQDHAQPPLFTTEFVLEPAQLTFAPHRDDFQDGVAEVIKRFQDCVLSVANLVPDVYFDAFT
ncbi:dynein heavy chain 6, axonemal-like, partial [Anneissia japonica]|uniref:dynein heavy chain 6, axonemal-like n=1 Tax=Anneissia japonica TaxID=1529436 RepID=UPI001425677B